MEAPNKKRGLEDMMISKNAPEEEVMKSGEKRRKSQRKRIVSDEESAGDVPEPAPIEEIDDDTLKPYDKLRPPSSEDFCPIADSP